MNKNVFISVLLVLAIAALSIHLFNRHAEGLRVDMTEANIYSLSDGSRDILAKIKKEGVKPIDVKLYFSYTNGKTLPKFIKNFINYHSYVRNLLREYERESDGKIRVSFIDPITDTDDAEDAADYGLDGKAINQQGDLFYFGLVFETQTGSKDIIDFLWPEKQETIEYEISKRIYGLVWPTKKRVAVLSGIEPLPDDNPYMAQLLAAQGKQPGKPWATMELLKEQFEVTALAKDVDQISHDEYDLLLVIHPTGFSDKQWWAIDEWVVTGGKTMVFLDPYCIEDQPAQNPQQPWAAMQYKPSSNMPELLNAWGLERPEDQLVGDYDLAVKRPSSRGGFAERQVVDLLITEDTRDQTLDSDTPIFKGINNMRIFTAGFLKKTSDVDGLTLTPLIQTTPAGNSFEIKAGFPGSAELVFSDLQNPAKILDAYTTGDQPLVLAYMIDGQFPSAFPEGASFPSSTPEPPPGMPPGMQMPPDENAEMIEKAAVPEDQRKPGLVLVFADTDFITDQLGFQQSFFGMQAANDNYKVLLNGADYMVGSEELMKVRSKETINRPFELFDRIEADADKRLLDQEREIRADIDRFTQELQEKQRNNNQSNANLFQKKVQDEIEALNQKIREDNRRLRDIRKLRRKDLEWQETIVAASIVWLMPVLVCFGGIFMYFRRKSKNAERIEG